jgi:hypothetical protein
MTPLSEQETETLELFGTAAAKAYVNQERRLRQVLCNVTTSMSTGSSATS